jgi:hypothetical protein
MKIANRNIECQRPSATGTASARGCRRMNNRAIRRASARLDHRPAVGDEQLAPRDRKTARRSSQRPRCVHPPAYSSVAMTAAYGAPHLIRAATITLTADALPSNPHSALPVQAPCPPHRGFLPPGLSDAYRRRGNLNSPSTLAAQRLRSSSPRGGRHRITLNTSRHSGGRRPSSAQRRSADVPPRVAGCKLSAKS